jgi:hypothetical protein
MRSGFRICALLSALLVSCHASKVATTPTSTMPLVQEHRWGNHVIEYDATPTNDYSFHASFEDDGDGNPVEVANLTIDGKEHQLRFRNGTLSLNGMEYGAVQKGDRVKLSGDGKVFVNGTERKP